MSPWRLVCAASAVAAAARETCAAGDCPASSPASGVSLIAMRSAITKRGLHADGLVGDGAFMSTKGIEKEASLLNQVIALPFDTMPPQSFLEDLASMRGTPHLKAFLNATSSSISGLLGNATAAASNDTKLRDRMFATFSDIAADFGKKKVTIQGHKDAAASAKTLHAECRTAESLAYVDKETCAVQKDTLSNQAQKALMTVQSQQGLPVLLRLCGNTAAGVGENVDDAYDPMKDLANATANFVKVQAEHKDKVGECGGLDTSHGTKRVECDLKQKAFEAAVCQHYTSSETECELYQALYSVKVADYKVVCDDIATREAERIIDVKHLKRVHCVVKALVTNINDKHALIQQIEICYTKTFDTSGLVIQPKPAPSPEMCPTSPTVVPCSGSFADQEYSALPKGVATATCENSCEVTTTTTTTTVTATTSTTITATTITATSTTTAASKAPLPPVNYIRIWAERNHLYGCWDLGDIELVDANGNCIDPIKDLMIRSGGGAGGGGSPWDHSWKTSGQTYTMYLRDENGRSNGPTWIGFKNLNTLSAVPVAIRVQTTDHNRCYPNTDYAVRLETSEDGSTWTTVKSLPKGFDAWKQYQKGNANMGMLQMDLRPDVASSVVRSPQC